MSAYDTIRVYCVDCGEKSKPFSAAKGGAFDPLDVAEAAGWQVLGYPNRGLCPGCCKKRKRTAGGTPTKTLNP